MHQRTLPVTAIEAIERAGTRALATSPGIYSYLYVCVRDCLSERVCLLCERACMCARQSARESKRERRQSARERERERERESFIREKESVQDRDQNWIEREKDGERQGGREAGRQK